MAEGHLLRERVLHYNCQVAAQADQGGKSWHATEVRKNALDLKGLGWSINGGQNEKDNRPMILFCRIVLI
jgi:hypothetical protein